MTVGREDAGCHTERIRATTLAVLVGLGFVVFGTLPSCGLVEWLGDSPVNQDIAMRTVSQGWFDLDQALPVTLVDIDERTWRSWNSPAITPRSELVRLMQTVTAAGPAAVVVDIDLSWGRVPAGQTAGEDPADRALRDYLTGYSGPPLVFPKRIESSETDMPRLARSPFDEAITGNPHLSWAHASFQTDGDGKVRDWRDWLAVCSDAGGQWLPSIATAINALVEPPPAGIDRPRPPSSADWDCATASGISGGSEQRLLLGPRLSGPAARTVGSGARSVSAVMLLDAEVARDDHGLFANRIVLIGATHESSGDNWLTTAGVLPGVELLANAVRYSAMQSQLASRSGETLRRLAALALFALYVLVDWRYRGVTRVFWAVAVTLLFVAIAIGGFDDLHAFEVVAAAVVMTIFYKALEALLEFTLDVVAEWKRRATGQRGFLRGAWNLLGATCKTMRVAARRPHASPPGASHDQH